MMCIIDQDLLVILEAFDRYGVKYMIVGGYAFNLYAEPRERKDIDIWVKSDLVNSRKIYSAFLSCNIILENIEDDEFVDKNNILVKAFRRCFSAVLVKKMETSQEVFLKRCFFLLAILSFDQDKKNNQVG
jgi:hypothetical protein